MKRETRVGYSVLRYVHDIATQEFVNVGVLAYAPDSRQIKFRCSDRLKRIHGLFPDVDHKRFSSLLGNVKAAFDSYACHIEFDMLSSSLPNDVMTVASKVLPADSSSLQWSSPAGGYAESLNLALDHAFERYVERYDRIRLRSNGVGSIMKPFRDGLKREGVFGYLKPKTFKGQLEKYEFDHTWKNEVYHCYQPVNLALKDHKLVESKAAEWFGRATDLYQTADPHRLHLLVAKPTHPSLGSVYADTVEGMKKIMPPSVEIVEQSEIEGFTLSVAGEIKAHQHAD